MKFAPTETDFVSLNKHHYIQYYWIFRQIQLCLTILNNSCTYFYWNTFSTSSLQRFGNKIWQQPKNEMVFGYFLSDTSNKVSTDSILLGATCHSWSKEMTADYFRVPQFSKLFWQPVWQVARLKKVRTLTLHSLASDHKKRLITRLHNS